MLSPSPLLLALLPLLVASSASAASPVPADTIPLPIPAAHRARQLLFKDRQGAFKAPSDQLEAQHRPQGAFETTPAGHLEAPHRSQGVFLHDHQWYAYPGSNVDSRSHDEHFQEEDTPFQHHEAEYDYEDDRRVTSDGGGVDNHRSESLGFSGTHVSRHPLFEESPAVYKTPASSKNTQPKDYDFAPTPSKSPVKKASPFSGFSPFLDIGASRPKGKPSSAVDRDEFLHHSNSYADDPTPYHVSADYQTSTTYKAPTVTYHEPATYQEDEGLLGKFKKYGGTMAPLLLATGLLFLFPSVQTITSRRRRRDLADKQEIDDSAEKTLLLVERLRTLYSSFDEDSDCPTRLFCELGDIIGDTANPARVIKYMDQFYPEGSVDMKIMKKAAHDRGQPQCHLYECPAKNAALASDVGEAEHQ